MVFGLFKKKPNKTQVALEVASRSLGLQLALATAGAKHVENDKFALGYLFGFHDGLLQVLNVSNQTEVLAITAVSFHRLFDDQAIGAALLQKCLKLQKDPGFRKGVMSGGQEAVAFLRDKTPPMSLASHLQTRAAQ